MATTVYLMRHGRTALNAAGVLRGRIDEPLDPAGRAEAARLGSLFAAVDLVRIVSSPLKRSYETACAVAEPHGLAVAVDPAFIDRDYGPWAGQRQEALQARYGAVDAAPADEVEPRAAFERRVATALERIAREADGGTAAVVAHDAVNRALIRMLGGRPDGDDAIPQPTGCWNRFVFAEGRITCDVVGALPGDGTLP